MTTTVSPPGPQPSGDLSRTERMSLLRAEIASG